MSYEDDEQFIAYADQVMRDLVPKIESSNAVVSLAPDGPGDVKFAIELGLSIMLGKPIIVVVTPGRQLPEKLVLVADAIVEGDIRSPGFGKRLRDTIDRVVKKVADESTKSGDGE